MGLTSDQRRAVEAPGDVCVTAGAGTGKTHMLSARYLQLLRAHGMSPLEIVATTFTDLAAAEMRARIRRDVAAAQPPFPAEVASELEAAPILTMHALAARICREHPEAAGVPADFGILDERPEGPLWWQERLDEAIAALPADVLAALPSDLLREALEAFLADPITAREALERDPDDLDAVLATERERIVRDLLQDPDWGAAVHDLRGHAGTGDRETQRQDALNVCEALARWTPDRPLPDLVPVLTLNLNLGKGKKGWDAEAHAAVTAALKTVRDLLRGYPLLAEAPGEVDRTLAAAVPCLRIAFDQVRAHLSEAKRRERVLDFGDLEVHALQALEDPEVVDHYRSRWRAFLLDEVQDTNPVQARLLSRLTAGSVLTIVGDEKQSIYGFRRADVTVFARMAEAIVARGGEKVSLAESFRTHADLMEGINRVCGPALGPLRQDLKGQRPAPHPAPHVEVLVVEKDAGRDVEARRRIEARHVARTIRGWVEDGLSIHDRFTDAVRPIRWGDVAILSRTGAPLVLHEEALAAEGVPATLSRGSDLLGTREALDAVALLRFLADRRDDQALVAVLRSPFFAVSDTILHEEADGRGKGVTWWEVVETSVRPELGAARSVLEDLRRHRDEPPSRLLVRADDLTGYTAVLAGLPGARRRLADWHGMLEWLRVLEAGAQDVHTVVRRLRRLMQAEIPLARPALEAGNAVLLTTIHAAKGLEWPVVVVPDLAGSSRADRARVRFDAALGVGLTFRDDDGETLTPLRMRVLRERVREREEAEERRIVYVALTRARDRLLLTAPEPEKGALAVLEEGLGDAGVTVEAIVPVAGDDRPPLPARVMAMSHLDRG
ncbi:MAG: UvrD-helicase domain-containing protein [bacterium]|nr:UvrD-helicase domain-containing protein [bacterium]